MRPFHFSLNAVRTLRRRQEQLALEAFARSVQARQAALDRRLSADQVLAAARSQLAEVQFNGAPVFRINQLRGHCQAMEEQVARCVTALNEAQSLANSAWEDLQDARRQLELVDKFYERRREEYDRQLRDEEQKQLDEMAGRRGLMQPVMSPPTLATWN
ncbi:MAG TPA: hypothetical protein DCY13_07180 [Verrucomicrobiales bacterium]|jgi:flagellar export protein FliJ|nr:hypothetical protein [Verrucomicrobiales bacterium]